MGTVAHTSLKLLNDVGANSSNIKGLVPGAGLEPARTLPGPRDFKSRVSTNSTIRAVNRSYENKTELQTISLNRGDYRSPSRTDLSLKKKSPSCERPSSKLT